MDECIYYDIKLQRCLEKHHQCHIEPQDCEGCRHKETWVYLEECLSKRRSSKRKDCEIIFTK